MRLRRHEAPQTPAVLPPPAPQTPLEELYCPYTELLKDDIGEKNATILANKPVSLAEHARMRGSVDMRHDGVADRTRLGIDGYNQCLPYARQPESKQETAEDGTPIPPPPRGPAYMEISGRLMDIEIDSSAVPSMAPGVKQERVDAVSIVDLRMADGYLMKDMLAASIPPGQPNPYRDMKSAFLVLEYDKRPGLHPLAHVDPDNYESWGDYRVVDLWTDKDADPGLIYGQKLKLEDIEGGTHVVAEQGVLMNELADKFEADIRADVGNDPAAFRAVIDYCIVELGAKASARIGIAETVATPDLSNPLRLLAQKYGDLFASRIDVDNVFPSIRPIIRAYYLYGKLAKDIRTFAQQLEAAGLSPQEQMAAYRQQGVIVEQEKDRLRREVVETMSATHEAMQSRLSAHGLAQVTGQRLQYKPIRYSMELIDDIDKKILREMAKSPDAGFRNSAGRYASISSDTELFIHATEGNAVTFYVHKQDAVGQKAPSYDYNGTTLAYDGHSGAFPGDMADSHYKPDIPHYKTKGIAADVSCAGPGLKPGEVRRFKIIDLMQAEGNVFFELHQRRLFSSTNQGMPKNLYYGQLAYSGDKTPMKAVTTHNAGDDSKHSLKYQTLIFPEHDAEMLYMPNGQVKVHQRRLRPLSELLAAHPDVQPEGRFRRRRQEKVATDEPSGPVVPVENGRTSRSCLLKLGAIGLHKNTLYPAEPEVMEARGVAIKAISVMRSERLPQRWHIPPSPAAHQIIQGQRGA